MARKPTGSSRSQNASPLNDPVTRYARDVVAGRIVAGPWVRLAGARHLKDLEEGPKRGLRFDIASAQRAIDFFPAVLRLAEGEHAGRPFVLQPSQAFIVGSLFGWKGPDGYRRFRTAYVEMGKGNGKSPLAGGIGLYMLSADGEVAAQCFAAATTREQAHILFEDAVKMVQRSPALRRRLTLSGRRKVFNIAYPETGSFFRPISSEGKTLDGKRVHFGAVDELHVHPNAVVVDKLRAGTKGRTQALLLEITNSGVDRLSVCYQHHDYSIRILQETFEDDSWFAYVCALDEGDDWRDPAVWLKANPLLGVSITEKYLAEQVREATGMPAKESIVRRLNFCAWVDAANPWIDGTLWRRCEIDFEIEKLRGQRCSLAIDLSAKKDLTALGVVFNQPHGHDAFVEFWTPADTLKERALSDRVPYDVWVRDKQITAVPGKSIDYAWVVQRLGELNALFEIESVAFDPWRIEDLRRELEAAGLNLPLVPHSQGFQGGSKEGQLWMPRSVDVLEQAVLQSKLHVKRNPALTWCSASAVLEADAKGNRVFTKRRSTGRIDGIVALAMAIGAASGNQGRRSYLDRGELLVL